MTASFALGPPATPPRPMPAVSFRLTAPNRAESAEALRELVCTLLSVAGLLPLIDDARLCTSEVVTNVHRHTRAPLINVDVSIGGEWVTVKVYDDAPRTPPVPREARLEDSGGRGLALVDGASDAWGSTQYGGLLPTFKAVWFSFDLRRRGLLG